MGCAASQQIKVTTCSSSIGIATERDGDPINANLKAALASKRNALNMLELAASSGQLHQSESAWADELQSTICELEKIVAQRQAALDSGGKYDHRQAASFSRRLAETASADLEHWINEHKPPIRTAPWLTPPSATRRNELTVLTPPESSLPGWSGDEQRSSAKAELEKCLAAARADLLAHLTQAEARAVELQTLKDRAAALQASRRETR